MEEKIVQKQSPELLPRKFDVQKGELEAVVTSFGNLDDVNDRILRGALDNYLEKGFDGKLPMLKNHDKNQIIGEWNKLYIEDDLVIAQGQIYPDVTAGSDVMALINRGMIGATSIGFRSRDFERNEEGGFDFKEIDLMEISMVRSPANPKAQILSAKSEDGKVDIRIVESILRDAGLSRKEARALLSDGKSALCDAVTEEIVKEQMVKGLTELLKGGLTNE